MARIPHNVFATSPEADPKGKTNWTQLAVDAAKGGDYESAINLFVTAISHDRRNAGLRYNLALALQRAGDIDDAAVALTEALRLKPGMPEAAQRLSIVLEQYQIEEPGRLDAAGLRGAFGVPGVGTEALGSTAFRLLKEAGPLGDAIARGRQEGWDTTATEMLSMRTAPLLSDALFLSALVHHTNRDIDIEHLLCALRQRIALLEPERFRDKDLLAFGIALAGQCLINEHVFDVTQDEQDAADALRRSVALSAKPSPMDIQAVVVALMYFPVDVVFGAEPGVAVINAMRPKALRDFILPRVSDQQAEHAFYRDLVGAAALVDDTSIKVADQYEARPYPRWTTLRRPRDGSYVKMMEQFARPERLAFMGQPFDVLIAGCGTGRHALQSALGYGANAKVTAIDLSLRSLAYARRMARDVGVSNISFRQGDLLALNPDDKMYDIIECIGVLHHLADPLAGLAAIERCLKPGGFMKIALYSAVSREELSELRFEPDFPGADCAEGEARRYRGALRDRAADTTGGELTNSIDFWSLSGFRDLVLHVSEQQFQLPAIAEALTRHGLIFRGFTLHPQTVGEFNAAYPNDAWPGSLENWWAYEQENPRLFDGMYNFWVEKPDPSRP